MGLSECLNMQDTYETAVLRQKIVMIPWIWACPASYFQTKPKSQSPRFQLSKWLKLCGFSRKPRPSWMHQTSKGSETTNGQFLAACPRAVLALKQHGEIDGCIWLEKGQVPRKPLHGTIN